MDLKVAKVSPLFKADDPCCFNNYRPISIFILFIFFKNIRKYNIQKGLFIIDILIQFFINASFQKKHSTYCSASPDKVTSALENNEFT